MEKVEQLRVMGGERHLPGNGGWACCTVVESAAICGPVEAVGEAVVGVLPFICSVTPTFLLQHRVQVQ